MAQLAVAEQPVAEDPDLATDPPVFEPSDADDVKVADGAHAIPDTQIITDALEDLDPATDIM